MKYKEWLNEWLRCSVSPAVKSRTADVYGEAIRVRITPDIGDRELEDLTPVVLQEFIARLTSRYSPNTVKGVISVLRLSLKRAEKVGVVSRQYTDCIVCPRASEKEILCLTEEEQRLVEKYALSSGKKKCFGFVMCLYTGLRVGELLALEWSDIDFDCGLISVNKTCRDAWKGGYKRITDSPKTRSSRRVIPLPKQLVPYLAEMKKSACGSLVLANEKGGVVSVRSYQRLFERMLRKLGIAHRGIHSLRHTFATRALECGMDVRTLSDILGHKNPDITLTRYAHSLLPHKTEMMNRLGCNLSLS